MQLPVLARRLHDAIDVIGIAKVVCDLGAALGLVDCTVLLVDHDGLPLICVDNASATDAERRDYFARAWTNDSARLHASHAPVGCDRGGVHELAIPLVEPERLIGSMRFRDVRPIDAETRHLLGAFGAHVSVRLAQLGVTDERSNMLRTLTPRQLEVCALVARGLSNFEIGESLGISANTVKKHVKDVFRELSVTNRAELAAWIGRSNVIEPSTTGDHDGLTITRATR